MRPPRLQNSHAPVIDNLLGLIGEHVTGEPWVALIFLGKSCAHFQIVQFPPCDGRSGKSGCSVSISWNIFGHSFHAMRLPAPRFFMKAPIRPLELKARFVYLR